MNHLHRTVRAACGWLAITSLLCAAVPAAADVAGEAAREAERIQREQRERIEQDRREARERQPRTATEIVLPQTPEPADGAQGSCRDITAIDLQGVELLDQEFQQRLLAPYVQQCLTVTDIERLLSDVTAAYIQRGFINARAYIPAQDLNTGVLRLLVVEGELESLRLEDDGADSVDLDTAFPRRVGRPFNLRDFEQGLDQINRLASNNATMDIKPGTKPGGSAIIIRNKPSQRVHGNSTYDNYGSTNTGRQQAAANLNLDNALGLNDSLMLSYRRTVSDDFDAQHSSSRSAYYSIPLGYLLFTGAYAKSDYATTLHLTGGDLLANGDQENLSLGTDYVAYRDAVNRVSISGTVNTKETRNYLAGQLLGVSSRKLSTFDLSGSWSTALAGGSLSTRAGHSWGLKAFGALDDASDWPDSLPQAQFRKWNVNLSWVRSFPLLERFLTFSSTLEGQHSDDVLYGAEQFSIGSLYSVRGFRDHSLVGDRGYFLRNELSLSESLTFGDTTIYLRPFLGFDTGEILSRQKVDGGHLSGASVGLNASSRFFRLDLLASEPLSMPDSLEDEGFQAFAKLTVIF